MRTHPVAKLLEQHCHKSAAGLLQLVRFYAASYTRKNAQVCYKSVYKLLTRCIRTACHKLSTGLEQLVDNLEQPCRNYQACCKVVLTSL